MKKSEKRNRIVFFIIIGLLFLLNNLKLLNQQKTNIMRREKNR